MSLLAVQDLCVEFRTRRGTARVLDRVGFAIDRGQTLGVVGESGCGKSVTALAILRLIASPPGRITGGQVWFDGRDLLTLPERYHRLPDQLTGAHFGDAELNGCAPWEIAGEEALTLPWGLLRPLY